MKIINGLNPSNKNQAHLFFYSLAAHKNGEDRHPQIVMNEMAEELGFVILDKIPQSMHDGWSFWIEGENLAQHVLPDYFMEHVKWFKIGTA